MINKINFCGKVYTAKKISYKIPQTDSEQIQKYADKKDCDVFVYDKSSYFDQVPIYYAIASKGGEIWKREFDMKDDKKSISRDISDNTIIAYDLNGYLDDKYNREIVPFDSLEQKNGCFVSKNNKEVFSGVTMYTKANGDDVKLVIENGKIIHTTIFNSEGVKLTKSYKYDMEGNIVDCCIADEINNTSYFINHYLTGEIVFRDENYRLTRIINPSTKPIYIEDIKEY